MSGNIRTARRGAASRQVFKSCENRKHLLYTKDDQATPKKHNSANSRTHQEHYQHEKYMGKRSISSTDFVDDNNSISTDERSTSVGSFVSGSENEASLFCRDSNIQLSCQTNCTKPSKFRSPTYAKPSNRKSFLSPTQASRSRLAAVSGEHFSSPHFADAKRYSVKCSEHYQWQQTEDVHCMSKATLETTGSSNDVREHGSKRAFLSPVKRVGGGFSSPPLDNAAATARRASTRGSHPSHKNCRTKSGSRNSAVQIKSTSSNDKSTRHDSSTEFYDTTTNDTGGSTSADISTLDGSGEPEECLGNSEPTNSHSSAQRDNILATMETDAYSERIKGNDNITFRSSVSSKQRANSICLSKLPEEGSRKTNIERRWSTHSLFQSPPSSAISAVVQEIKVADSLAYEKEKVYTWSCDNEAGMLAQSSNGEPNGTATSSIDIFAKKTAENVTSDGSESCDQNQDHEVDEKTTFGEGKKSCADNCHNGKHSGGQPINAQAHLYGSPDITNTVHKDNRCNPSSGKGCESLNGIDETGNLEECLSDCSSTTHSDAGFSGAMTISPDQLDTRENTSETNCSNAKGTDGGGEGTETTLDKYIDLSETRSQIDSSSLSCLSEGPLHQSAPDAATLAKTWLRSCINDEPKERLSSSTEPENNLQAMRCQIVDVEIVSNWFRRYATYKVETLVKFPMGQGNCHYMKRNSNVRFSSAREIYLKILPECPSLRSKDAPAFPNKEALPTWRTDVLSKRKEELTKLLHYMVVTKQLWRESKALRQLLNLES